MSAPQWTADIDIDRNLAAVLIAARFPEFAGARVEAFGAGWDNAAFLADRRVVFRFPRRRVAARLIECEIAFLPEIARRLPIAISAPAYAGAPTPAYPHAFAGYPLLAGTTACSRDLTAAERSRLARPLGAFLRALHAIDAAPLVARGLPPDEIGRLDHEKRLEASRRRVDVVEGSGLCDDVADFVAWLETHPAVLAERQRSVVHGDLYARHLLLDADAGILGVIDWGDLHYGDPAIDVSIAHLMLPAAAHAEFHAAYGAIDERTWNTARYRAIYHAILQLDYGIRENDEGMRRSGKAALALMRG